MEKKRVQTKDLSFRLCNKKILICLAFQKALLVHVIWHAYVENIEVDSAGSRAGDISAPENRRNTQQSLLYEKQGLLHGVREAVLYPARRTFA